MPTSALYVNSKDGVAKVEYSGTIICLKNSGARIELEDLSFNLLFVTEVGGTKSVNLMVDKPKEGNLIVKNFSSPLGESFRIRAGIINQKPLFLDCVIYTITGVEQTDRIVNFSFLTKEGAFD